MPGLVNGVSEGKRSFVSGLRGSVKVRARLARFARFVRRFAVAQELCDSRMRHVLLLHWINSLHERQTNELAARCTGR